MPRACVESRAPGQMRALVVTRRVKARESNASEFCVLRPQPEDLRIKPNNTWTTVREGSYTESARAR